MVAQIALVLWIVISIAMFALLPPLRAFVLTYVIGILFLPVEVQASGNGVIIFTQSLQIEKYVACNIGAIIGTLIFAPYVLKRYRFHWLDVAFAVVLIGQFLTSVINDQGAKDGFSLAVESTRDYLPIIILARLYVTSVGDVYHVMRAIIGGALIYSLICVLEWRFSPQFHRLTYGYFQHDFGQFMRDEHFRPAGYLRHAIEVSCFMGSSTALASWLWFKKLFKPLWGVVPIWLIVPALLIGTLSTMTVSGIGEMMLVMGLLALVVLMRSRWILVMLPIMTMLWMAGRYTHVVDEGTLLQTARIFVSEARVESLRYRLDAEELNLAAASDNLLLGRGPQNAFAKKDDGKTVAQDAWWLIQITFFGLTNVLGWYLIWCACIFETFARWKRLTPDLQTVSAAVCLLVGTQFVDFLFNSFPSMFLLILSVGLVSALQRYKPAPALRRVYAPPGGASAIPPEMVMP